VERGVIVMVVIDYQFSQKPSEAIKSSFYR